MTAFLGAVAESLGEESRFIHLGLTSSDVMDTALSLQLIEATDIIIQDIKEFTSVLAQRAIEHKYTVMIGRTHGIHAEPTSFGLKLAIWIDEMRRNLQRLTEAKKDIAAGKISGAVGTYATVPPEVEQKACRRLHLAPAPISNQILQRDPRYVANGPQGSWTVRGEHGDRCKEPPLALPPGASRHRGSA